jgi:hypothetical protein
MPRIYTSASDPLDFCKKHFPTEADALARYGNVGDGPDDRGNCFGWDDGHPEYEGTDYTCEICGAKLTRFDD